MKSFNVTIQNNLPPDFCMKNRGLFLKRRRFLTEEVTEEVTEEKTSEEPSEEPTDEEEEIDPELQKELDAWANK